VFSSETCKLKKLLLVQPPIEDFYDTEVRLQPIGLASLKAAVHRFLPQVKVRIIDFHQGWGRRTVPIPRELRDLRRFYPVPDRSPVKTFHEFYRFGATASAMEEVFAREAPDYVGISSLFSAYHREALETAAVARSSTRAVTILGGSHVTSDPLGTLRSPAVDFVIGGEGEKALVRLLQGLIDGWPVEAGDWSSIPGVGFKVGGHATLVPGAENSPIDEIPVPDLSDFLLGRYTHRGRPVAQLVSSRGCPHHCSFCSVHTTFGAGYRARAVESVFREIEERFVAGYGVIDFEDDNLTCRQDRMKELCRRLIERFRGEGPELVAMNGVSYLSLDLELLELMRQAGFSQLNLSLVSSDRSVLLASRRPHSMERLEEVVSEGLRLGFGMTCYQILGLPFEPLESMIGTLAFLARLPVRVGASPFYLAPGSPIAGSHGFDTASLVRCRLTAMGIDTAYVNRSEIFTLFVICRVVNFLKSLAIPSNTTVQLEEVLGGETVAAESTRQQEGFRVLRRLLKDGRYIALTKHSEEVVEAFSPDLFRRTWAAIPEIATLQAARIHLF